MGQDPYYIRFVADLSGLPTAEPSPTIIIAGIVNLVLSVAGVIAIAVVLWGGYQWLTSLGNEEKIRRAKTTLANGAIGLAIIFTSYIVTRFIVFALAGATGAGS